MCRPHTALGGLTPRAYARELAQLLDHSRCQDQLARRTHDVHGPLSSSHRVRVRSGCRPTPLLLLK